MFRADSEDEVDHQLVAMDKRQPSHDADHDNNNDHDNVYDNDNDNDYDNDNYRRDGIHNLNRTLNCSGTTEWQMDL
eukprot:CAMPEP_0175165244 /NCGR_PEP_ID=MMETSP0087-20121206/26950_1 /TAXON_ID=136419 /ORGANISM="Unknown Unknown, Strain D1" /LENGTH=75 /DNA_ID=CAMNT_0016454543 /DNA_START=73 /DNA_END=296 /DNA_ORIENTATION=-